jgi:hypothetical protein
MLYVAILYCVGFCPASLPAPNGVLFYSSLADCKATIASMNAHQSSRVIGADGKPMPHTRFLSTCATMYADPEQLDRILNPEKLEKLLRDAAVGQK